MQTMLTTALLVSASAVHAAALTPASVEQFFVNPRQPVVLQWHAEGRDLTGSVEYTLRDYWGKPIASGRAKADGKTIAVSLHVPASFCEIEFPATQQRFGLVALPDCQGSKDPFFAIDSALSWLVRDDAMREGLIKALRRSGVVMSRERLAWGQVNPAEGNWQWESPSRYENVRQLHARHGVEVLEMFHDSPGWLGRVGKYPQDLVKTARAWEEITKRWRPTWGALEVWNEPDIFFGDNLPADQYVPLVEAVGHALGRARTDVPLTPAPSPRTQGGKRGQSPFAGTARRRAPTRSVGRRTNGDCPLFREGSETPLVGGVFAHYNRAYLDNAAANGLLECVDVVSFHTYGRAMEMESLVENYRSWLRAHGRESMPLWITECGRPWKRGPERPPVDQDAASALDIIMKGVEARACGIARYFAFVYPYYDENQNNFGMMDRHGSPLRSMGAYARLVGVLAGKDYLGDLKCGESVKRARVFGDQKETIAVLYTGKPDTQATVKLDLPVLRVEGLDGRELKAADGRVPVPDGLAYVWLDRARLGDRLTTNTSAMRLWKTGRQTGPRRAQPSPIIMRFEFDRGVLSAKTEGYRVAEKAQSRVPVRVRVFNLADQPHELTIKLSLPDKAKIVEGADTKPLRLPAGKQADVDWAVDLSQELGAAGRARLRVTAASKSAARVSPRVIDLSGDVSLTHVLQRYPKAVRLPILELPRWKASISGSGRMTMEVAGDAGWRLTAQFTAGDRWVYPSFRLPDAVDLTRAEGLAIRARCHKPGAVRLFLWEGDGGVGYLTPHPVIPADGQWHTAVVPLKDFTLSHANAPDPDGTLDLRRVRRISVGMNSEAMENTLEVSDMCVLVTTGR